MTAEQLRLIRLLNGLSQRSFAKSLNLSHPLISKIERGDRVVTQATKRRVMEVFGVSDEKLTRLQLTKEMLNDGS